MKKIVDIKFISIFYDFSTFSWCRYFLPHEKQWYDLQLIVMQNSMLKLANDCHNQQRGGIVMYSGHHDQWLAGDTRGILLPKLILE